MQVLNAKPENVEREAEIVAQSGRVGAVTIATNMAGRGTDIILGGNSEFMARLKLREMLMPRYCTVPQSFKSSEFRSLHFMESICTTQKSRNWIISEVACCHDVIVMRQ